MPSNECDIYLRLSDGRVEEAFEGREAKLRAEADRIGWSVRSVVIENDINPDGTIKPASAWKRRRVTLPSGHTALRVIRPKFRDVILPDAMNGINILAEYGDRITRDPRDGEDFLEAIEIGRSSLRSLSGRLALTDGGTDRERDYFRDEVRFAEREGRAKRERAENGRERWAGKSYQGGRRPFGFRVDPNGTEHHRNLIHDEVEAEVIRWAADQIVNKSISIKSLARDLRVRGIKTVTGKPFDAERLRETLCKPAIVGIQLAQVRTPDGIRTEERRAPWEPIITDRSLWDSMVCILTDPSRRTNGGNGNEPVWLLSCIAVCGTCGHEMKVSGNDRNKYYVCKYNDGCSTRRHATTTDEFISGIVVSYLSKHAATLLKPPARKDVDVTGLRREAKRLDGKRAEARAMWQSDDISSADLSAMLRDLDARTDAIEAQIASADSAPDPLADFRDKPAQSVWDSLSVARKRAVVRLLMQIRFLTVPARTPFDPDSIAITWKAETP